MNYAESIKISWFVKKKCIFYTDETCTVNHNHFSHVIIQSTA